MIWLFQYQVSTNTSFAQEAEEKCWQSWNIKVDRKRALQQETIINHQSPHKDPKKPH